MNLTPHFTVAEFTASQTAARRGIDNSLPAGLLMTAKETCELLERIRSHLGNHPVILTSGYRCLELNAAIGSRSTSDHCRAKAADFKVPGFGTPYEVCRALELVTNELGIGQLIHEYGGWVHVSTERPKNPVNWILTISRRGTEVGIREV